MKPKRTWKSEYEDIRWHRPIRESDVQIERFTELMAGRTFANDVRTKSTGRIGCPNPTHVMAESNLARCG